MNTKYGVQRECDTYGQMEELALEILKRNDDCRIVPYQDATMMKIGVIVNNVFLYFRLMRMTHYACDDGAWENALTSPGLSMTEKFDRLIVAWKHGHGWLEKSKCDQCAISQVMEE